MIKLFESEGHRFEQGSNHRNHIKMKSPENFRSTHLPAEVKTLKVNCNANNYARTYNK